MADTIKDLADYPQSFIREGTQFMNRCTKPNKKEYLQICRAVGLGVVIMGFIGYFVKLIHIPLRHIRFDMSLCPTLRQQTL
ncbi:hypothetical protein OC846_002481 [Tilletia horrida]|uniref:Protein transport protein Sec61 subunit gamma n=1 Tax=Tilletia horrida TaxID=155126 RepID=A0AAN6GR55_9BASI|nr:hypothetical protein OC845_001901 [Tilletia horrida]KAK0553560.1 hypothetical protein OC846_002481 [Tilletia horrida]